MPRADLHDTPIITLTSDFGLSDSYVGAVKGVILSINPQAAIIDISHDVRPQQPLQAVFLTQTAWRYFPDNTVHIAIVDPGVGTKRAALVLETPHGRFVGPDNGVLSAALPDKARADPREGLSPVELPAGFRAYSITNERFMRLPVSATFHGRDVFGPAAAHLSLGIGPSELGEAVTSVLAYPPIRARRAPDGSLEARVVHVDRFGNLVTDARAEDLPGGPLAVELKGQRISGPVRTYADASRLTSLVASSGYLAVILPQGDAAAALGAGIGDEARIKPAR